MLKIQNNLHSIINQRLKLQSTQKSLAQYGVNLTNLEDLEKIKSEFVKKFISWDDLKKNRFAKLLGGNTNYCRTMDFLVKLK